MSAAESAPVVAYLFTTFPKSTETFLQREIASMRALGQPMRIYSLWGGSPSFRGLPVHRFNKWLLLTLIWKIPAESWRRPEVLREVLRGLFTRRAPSWLNFWENMLGAGFACLFAEKFRKDPPALVHGAWGGAPATAAWLLWRLNAHPYSAAAHAYDIFEHGGDWWLNEKLGPARFIHTSTEMGRQALIARGIDGSKVVCIRRGLERLLPMKRLRNDRKKLHLLCIARLVEKKGLDHQLRIYSALAKAGIEFEARIVGEGPLRQSLEAQAGSAGIGAKVTFTGHLAQQDVWMQLDWADALLHTGVIAPSGDRDGLPNVIPEAMSVGVVVLTSPTAATTEAITHHETGFVAAVDNPAEWVEHLKRLQRDEVLAERLRKNARRWVEQNFDAYQNASRLLAHFRKHMPAYEWSRVKADERAAASAAIPPTRN